MMALEYTRTQAHIHTLLKALSPLWKAFRFKKRLVDLVTCPSKEKVQRVHTQEGRSTQTYLRPSFQEKDHNQYLLSGDPMVE